MLGEINIFVWFLLFILYSMLGWLIEILNVKSLTGKWVNRGFLIGPYCPIYGVSAVIMVLYLNKYIDNMLTVFFLACIVCSIVEYLTSYFMEKIFQTRWWDYSDRRFNLEGRICLENCIAFGILGVFLVYVMNPFLLNLLLSVNNNIITIISIIMIIIFVNDSFISFNIINKLKNNFKDDEKKDSTEEIVEYVKKSLEKQKKKLQKRIVDAFPQLKPVKKKKKN